MKLYDALLYFLVLSIGLGLGAWVGVETVYIEVETIPTKTVLDVIATVSSFVAAVAAVLGLIFAIYVFKCWNKQQLDLAIMNSKLSIINGLSHLSVELAKVLLVPEDRTKTLPRLHLVENELRTNLKQLYVLNTKSRGKEHLSVVVIAPTGDSLDNVKSLLAFSSDLRQSINSGKLKHSQRYIDFSECHTLKVSTSDLLKEAPDPHQPMTLYVRLSELIDQAMLDIRDSIAL